jgi:4-amino-4-deoxy-L-arabinose transferase-like glycosyltransferase
VSKETLGRWNEAVRLGLLLLNAATIVLVYRLGVRLADATAGLAAAAGFGALSLCPAVLGFTANTEHFLLLPALGGSCCCCGSWMRLAVGLCSGAASCSASRC